MKPSKNFTAADGVSLKEYFETRLCAIEKASELQRETLNIRLEAMNEFRDAMKDQTVNYLTRNEYEIHHCKLEDDITELKKYRNIMEGKASQSSVIFLGIISLISLLLGVADFVLRQ